MTARVFERLAGMSNFQLRVISICIAINMLDGFDIFAMAFTAPAIARQWSLDSSALGILFSVGLGGMMIGSIILGPLADRFGRRPLILVCLIVSVAGMLSSALSDNLNQLILSRLLTGFAVGGMLPCINTMVAEYASPRGRAFSISLLQAGFPIGASVGGLIAVWLLAQADWHAVFLCGAVLTGLLIPVAWFYLPESLVFLEAQPARAVEANKIRDKMGETEIVNRDTVAASGLGSFVPGLKNHSAALLLALGIFFSTIMSFYFIASWTPKILVDSGLSESAGVSSGTLLTAGGIAAAVILAWTSLHRSVTSLVIVLSLLSAGMTVLFGQLNGELWLILLTAFVLGTVINATQIGIYSILPSLFPSSIRAGATGLVIGTGRLGAVMGPLLAGFLLSDGWSIGSLFAVMSVPYLVAAIMLIKLRRFQVF